MDEDDTNSCEHCIKPAPEGRRFCSDQCAAEDIGRAMTFGQAITATTTGALVAREGWNGKGMSVRRTTLDELEQLGPQWLPFLVMKTADNRLVPWLASQADMLAADWTVIEWIDAYVTEEERAEAEAG